MNKQLVKVLCCPKCKSNLKLVVTEEKDGTVVGGNLECHEGDIFPIANGVPRFVRTDQYTHTFSFQWNRFSRVQLDVYNGTKESEQTFRMKTGFKPENLKGKLVLDAGVGAGRFADVVSRHGAEVIGIDLSRAVEAANENIGSRQNVHIVQADIFQLPFRAETFDYIFSIGVLHHTPETRKAFQKLIPLLKTGGEIAIWVYDSYTPFKKITNTLRKVTTRLPKRLVYYSSTISIPLYFLKPFRMLMEGVFRLCMHRNWKWRWLDTFDYYTPEFQWKHTYPEVYGWFEENGLTEITPLSAPVSMKGKKQTPAS
jgi:SAM-dependent methyltransferase